jgi:hypothetical protein
MDAQHDFIAPIILLALTAALAACGPSATEVVGAGTTGTLEYSTTPTYLNSWPSWTPRFSRTPTLSATPTANATQKAEAAARGTESMSTQEAWIRSLFATQTAFTTRVVLFGECGNIILPNQFSPDENWVVCGGGLNILLILA